MVLGFFEGSMDVRLDKSDFTLGDTVSGRAVLNLKKDKKCRGLKLRFNVFKVTEEQSEEVGTREQRVSLYKHEDVISDKKSFSKGEHEFDFSFKIPRNIRLPAKRRGLTGFLIGLFTPKKWVEAKLNVYLDLKMAKDINKTVKLNLLY